MLLASGNCIENCPSGTWYDEDTLSCVKCGHNCLECSEDECLVCQEEFYLNADMKTCTFGCPYQTFLKIYEDDFICDNCHKTCANCVNPSETSCTSCPPELYLYSELLVQGIQSNIPYSEFVKNYPVQGECLKMCKKNTGPLGRICIPCPSNCLSCANDKCLLCAPGFKIDLNG